VPANFQRFLPLLLIFFLLVFVLPTIMHRHKSKNQLSAGDLSDLTIATTTKVDTLEQRLRTAGTGYTKSVADLLALDHALGRALANGIVITLDASTNHKTYYAQVASPNILLVRARDGGRLITKSCLVVKSASGVDCPKPPQPATTSTGTTTTGPTTTGSG